MMAGTDFKVVDPTCLWQPEVKYFGPCKSTTVLKSVVQGRKETLGGILKALVGLASL